MDQYNLIDQNPDVCWGQPTIKDTRLTIFNVINGINNDSIEAYSQDHGLTLIAIKQALGYCRTLKCINEINKYCDGCVLNREKGINPYSYSESCVNIFKTKDDNYFLGHKEEFKNEVDGEKGWVIADNLYLKNFNV